MGEERNCGAGRPPRQDRRRSRPHRVSSDCAATQLSRAPAVEVSRSAEFWIWRLYCGVLKQGLRSGTEVDL